jgi:diguanylate cyclase (GGDEF)-like protein
MLHPGRTTQTNNMDKRVFTRHPIRLEGWCSVPGEGKRTVEIRDFCPGGLYLSYHDRSDDWPPRRFAPAHNSAIEIHASVPAPDGETTLLFRGRVVRIDQNGAGVAFVDPDFEALRVLHDFAKKQPPGTATQQSHQAPSAGPAAGASKLGDSAAQALLRACREMAGKHLEPMASTFLQRVTDRFFGAAGEVQGIAEKNAYYDGLSVFNKHGDTFKSEFVARMRARLNEFPAGAAGAPLQVAETGFSESTLSLVEEDAFEDWLAFSDMARQSETEYPDLLGDLEQRLGVLYRVPLDKANNPFGPASFSQAFQDALKGLTLDRRALKVCSAVFKDVLCAELGQLYDDLNRNLVENKVLPDLKPKYTVKLTKAQASTTRPAAEPASRQEAASPGGAHSVAGAPAPQDWYDLVQDLRILRQQASQQTAHRAGAAAPQALPSAMGAGAAPQYYTAEELLFALSQVRIAENGQSVAGDFQQDVKSQLLSALAGGAMGSDDKLLPDREARILEVAGNLLGSVLADRLVAKNVRPWLQQLSIPLFKMALHDDSLFFDKSHPARQVINSIAQLELYGGDGGDTSQNTVKKRIDNLLDEITAAPEVTPALFDRVLRPVKLLIQLQNKAYEENIKEVFLACEEEERHIQAEGPAPETGASPTAGKTPDSGQVSPEMAEEIREGRKHVRRLKMGDWVLLNTGSTTQRLKLAWVSRNFERYVFVNVKGLKEATLSQDELARHLHSGAAVVLDDGGEPLLDRAQYAMLQKMHGQLLHETTHDQLTGLINRREFERHLTEGLTSARQAGIQHTICYLDLDQFNVVNNTFGYDGGDRLLVEISRLLEKELGDHGILARIGGDEFGMLLEHCTVEDAMAITDRQKAAIRDYRFSSDGKSLSISFSAGLVSLEPDSDSVATLLQAAEASCRIARGKGTNYVQVYRPDDIELSRRMQAVKWVAKIDEALDSDGLELRFQPIARITEDGTAPDHSEVLLGVPDDQGKLLSPADFIIAAESFRRIAAVDRWVIEHVFRWLAEDSAALAQVGGVAINLSGASLNEEGFVEFIIEQAEKLNVPMDKVCFEVTETAGIANLSNAAEFILAVKKSGCLFSLDDFGSGLSSYAYLKNLPVDFLKIDGAFIKNMDENPYDYAVVKSITEIGHFMGKKIIAEHVESDTVLDMLREIGVDFAQGYVVGKPRSMSELNLQPAE